MSDQNPIIWTPFRRQSVIDFLKLYTKQLEGAKDDPENGHGLPGIQSGVLHLADQVLPSGIKYVVNRGPEGSILDGVQVIYTDADAQKFENARSGELENNIAK